MKSENSQSEAEIPWKPLRASLGRLSTFLPHLLRQKRAGLTVFIFHSVTKKPGPFEQDARLAVSPTVFKMQLEWILRQYEPIYPQILDRGGPLPPDACLITFDDGWPGTWDHAFPLLEQHKVPALAFLNLEPLEGKPLWAALAFWIEKYKEGFTAWMRERDVWKKEMAALSLTPALLRTWEGEHGAIDQESLVAYQGPPLTWKQISQWDGHPLIFYGNHLYNHWNAATMTDADLKDAFLKNQDGLDRLQSGTRHFAFPFGTFLPHQPSLLFQWGASHIYESGAYVNNFRDRQRLLGRVNIGPWDDCPPLLQWEVTRFYWEKMFGKVLLKKIRSTVKKRHFP